MYNCLSVTEGICIDRPSFWTQWTTVWQFVNRKVNCRWQEYPVLASVLWASTDQLLNSTFLPSQVFFQKFPFFHCQSWGMANAQTVLPSPWGTASQSLCVWVWGSSMLQTWCILGMSATQTYLTSPHMIRVVTAILQASGSSVLPCLLLPPCLFYPGLSSFCSCSKQAPNLLPIRLPSCWIALAYIQMVFPPSGTFSKGSQLYRPHLRHI